MDLIAKQFHAGAVLKLNLCQGHGFTFKVHIVAVRALDQALYFLHVRRDRVIRLSLVGAPDFVFKIQILGVISRRVGIGDIGGHELLPRSEQIHVPFQLRANSVQHGVSLRCTPPAIAETLHYQRRNGKTSGNPMPRGIFLPPRRAKEEWPQMNADKRR